MACAWFSSFRAEWSGGESSMECYAGERHFRIIRAIAQAPNPYAAPFMMQIEPTAHHGLAKRFRTGRETMTPGTEKTPIKGERNGRLSSTKLVFNAASTAPSANHLLKIRPFIPFNVREASSIRNCCRRVRRRSPIVAD